jgi:hypothetical protein
MRLAYVTTYNVLAEKLEYLVKYPEIGSEM